MDIKKLIQKMTLEEKCYLLSGKDFWQTRSVERLGLPNVTLADGPHGVRQRLRSPTAGTLSLGKRSGSIWVWKPPPRMSAYCWGRE